MGSRRFKNKILNPIFDCDKLNKEYDITEYIINKRGETLISEWRNNMGELKDIEKLHRQIIHNKVTPRNLFHLYNNLSTISTIYEKIKSDKGTTKAGWNVFTRRKKYYKAPRG